MNDPGHLTLGLRRGKAESVTFEGGGEVGEGSAAGRDGVEEVLHQGFVRAGVEGKAGQVGVVFVNEPWNHDMSAVGLQNTFCADDSGGAAFPQGGALKVHMEPRTGAQSSLDLLGVVNVVVAAVHAAAVTARKQLCINHIDQIPARRDVKSVHPLPAFPVEPDGGVRAIRDRAIRAAGGGPVRGAVHAELAEDAGTMYLLYGPTGKPHQEIGIMAAFGKENGAGVLHPGPQAAHKCMRHPVRTDVLRMVNLNDVSQQALVNNLLDPAEVGMETHLQADAYVNVVGKRCFQKGHILRKRLCYRFFQQNMVTVAYCLKRYGNVQPVRRCHNYRLNVPRYGKEFYDGCEAAAGGNTVQFRCGGKPQGIRLHDTGNIYLFRETGEVLSCTVSSAYDGYVHHLSDSQR